MIVMPDTPIIRRNSRRCMELQGHQFTRLVPNIAVIHQDMSSTPGETPV